MRQTVGTWKSSGILRGEAEERLKKTEEMMTGKANKENPGVATAGII